MKRLLLPLPMPLPAFQWSAEEITALVLHFASGKDVTCKLDELPVVTFSDDALVIYSKNNY